MSKSWQNLFPLSLFSHLKHLKILKGVKEEIIPEERTKLLSAADFCTDKCYHMKLLNILTVSACAIVVDIFMTLLPLNSKLHRKFRGKKVAWEWEYQAVRLLAKSLSFRDVICEVQQKNQDFHNLLTVFRQLSVCLSVCFCVCVFLQVWCTTL